MRKEYQKPEADFVSLVAEEMIMDTLLDGETSVESSDFNN